MTTPFQVEILSFKTVQEAGGAWGSKGYIALLDEMENGGNDGASEAELRELCLMSLQDLEPNEAAFLVLKQVIGDKLRDGQLHNMANEMREDKLWEEYVDPAFHAQLFTVGSLLYAAQPGTFPKTDAVQVTLKVTAPNADSTPLFMPAADKPFIARLIAGGMDDHAVLNRLYEDQLRGTSFPNAGDIIWQVDAKAISETVYEIAVLSSGYWLGGMEDTESFEVAAHPDEALED